MAEIVTKNLVCPLCGTETRAGAAFCYHCGGAVAAAETLTAENNVGFDSPQIRPRGDDGENQNGHKITSDSLTDENVEETSAATGETAETELISAAKMRRRPKKFQQKRVEITWEEPTGATGATFVIAAILLILLAIGVWFLAGYLK